MESVKSKLGCFAYIFETYPLFFANKFDRKINGKISTPKHTAHKSAHDNAKRIGYPSKKILAHFLAIL